MAKLLKKTNHGLNIRFIKKDKKYFITYGVMHIRINDVYCSGYDTIEEAEEIANKLIPTQYVNRYIYEN